jgi:DNA polymerase-1
VNIEPLRPWVETPKIRKIGHNLKFDYKMMRGTFDMRLEGIRDTFLAEKVMSAGLTHYLSKEHKFDKVVNKWTGKVIEDKERLQKSFIGHVGDFSQEQLDYAADDTLAYDVLKAQVPKMEELGLIPTFMLESNVCAAFGDMEFDGMKLDTTLWESIRQANMHEAAKLVEKMNAIAINYLGANLFGEVQINYGSPKQVLDLLRKMQLKVSVWDPKLKKEVVKMIDKTSDEFLKKIKGVELVDHLRNWRSLNTRVNNFGESYINAVHPRTGCIHPNMWQTGTGTGRPAAGESDVNPLNIPRDKIYRKCFICEDDEVVESDDFSGCESRILAHISQDPILLDIFKRGEDIHCAVASMLYNVTVTKKENKELRTPAKALNFGISYGSGPNKLCDTLNGQGFKVTRAESKVLYDKYVDRFNVAVGYLRTVGRQAYEQGYLANLNGRRRWWNIEAIKSGPAEDRDWKKAAVEREAGNFAIQSVNADITKEAMVRIRKYRLENKVRTKFINAVYDEIVTRTHKDDSESFHKEKLRIMQESAEKWITSVPMLVDGAVGSHWLKD